jgi:hypothetical protein
MPMSSSETEPKLNARWPARKVVIYSTVKYTKHFHLSYGSLHKPIAVWRCYFFTYPRESFQLEGVSSAPSSFFLSYNELPWQIFTHVVFQQLSGRKHAFLISGKPSFLDERKTEVLVVPSIQAQQNLFCLPAQCNSYFHDVIVLYGMLYILPSPAVDYSALAAGCALVLTTKINTWLEMLSLLCIMLFNWVYLYSQIYLFIFLKPLFDLKLHLIHTYPIRLSPGAHIPPSCHHHVNICRPSWPANNNIEKESSLVASWGSSYADGVRWSGQCAPAQLNRRLAWWE